MSAEPQETPPVAQPAQTQALEPARPSAARPAVPLLPPQPDAHSAGPPVARGTGAALARLQAAAGQLIPQLQYRVARLGTAGQAGLATLTAAVAVAVGVLLPAYHAMQTVSADLLRAQHAPSGYTLEQAVPHLMAALPTRAQIPAVLGQVYAQAKAAGVPLDTGRYVYTPAKSGTIAHYDLEFPVKGAGYPAIRTFINGTLTAVPAASLDKLQIERKAVGEQAVNADIGFVVFVRSEDGP